MIKAVAIHTADDVVVVNSRTLPSTIGHISDTITEHVVVRSGWHSNLQGTFAYILLPTSVLLEGSITLLSYSRCDLLLPVPLRPLCRLIDGNDLVLLTLMSNRAYGITCVSNDTHHVVKAH